MASSNTGRESIRATLAILTLGTALALSGCGGEGVQSAQATPPGSAPVDSYSGPAPANTDRQAFRLSVWEDLRGDDRCGDCHSVEGGQDPMFVRRDDVNLAYDAALPLVDRDTTALSLLASKVRGGHNCWLASDAACADIIVRSIDDWVGGTGGGDGKQIVLTAPQIRDVGNSKTFPASSAGFAAELHTILTDFCAECHAEDAETPQAPYFANANADSAYAAARARIDLDNPANSRLVVRLREEFHNCWSGNCADDADTMETAIDTFSGNIIPTEVNRDLVISKALRIADGVAAAGASRHEEDAIAIWEFKTGTGTTAFDTSGVDPAMDLTLTDTAWVGGFGIEFNSASSKAQARAADSVKLYNLIRPTGEYSIEAWVVPANVTQEGPARIITYSGNAQSRNFMLGQTLYNYDFQARTSATDENGEPALSTDDADEVLQATQQHVVLTYDPVNGRRIYVNGEFTGYTDPSAPGDFNDWDSSFVLALGNEVSNDRAWAGKLRMVAIHNRILTDEQIAENFEAGVGQKFYLLFGLSHLIEATDAYLMFEVSQFDDHSYLFSRPTFVSLDSSATPAEVQVRGLRIGINGKEAGVGQSYARLATTIGGTGYEPGGQVLSELGAVIALEKGPDSDEFFVTFDLLDQHQFVRIDDSSLISLEGPATGPAADIGLRTFDEIDASMSAMTGIPRTNADVSLTFQTIRQQLPTVETIDGFLSAHQIAIAQLAIEYCNALVDRDRALASSDPARFFADLDFTQAANQVYATQAGRALLLDPLLDRILAVNPTTAPAGAPATDERTEIETELTTLVSQLSQCTGGCDADRTATVAKASCSALLGSAVSLLQ